MSSRGRSRRREELEESVEERRERRGRGREVAPPLMSIISRLQSSIFSKIDAIRNLLMKKTFLTLDDWFRIEDYFYEVKKYINQIVMLISRSTRVTLTARFIERLNVEIDKYRDLSLEIDNLITSRDSVNLLDKIRQFRHVVDALIMRIMTALVTLEEMTPEEFEKIVTIGLTGVEVLPTIEIPASKYSPMERIILQQLLSFSYLRESEILTKFGKQGVEAVNSLVAKGVAEVVYDPLIGENIVRLVKGVKI